MSGTSRKSRVIGVRLSNATIAKIEYAMTTCANQDTSVSGYCKRVIERYAFRHVKKKKDGG